jgi:hypothetical protein
MGFDLAVLNRLRRMGTVATVFSPVSLFAASEPGVWYDPSDLTTMFQDTAGTTPVTTPGQTVALLLDKSKGLVLGSELVTNGDFSAGSTGWTQVSGSWTFSDGRAIAANADSIKRLSNTTSSMVAGRWYKITWSQYAGVGTGAANWSIPGVWSGVDNFANGGSYINGEGEKTVYFLAPVSGQFYLYNFEQAVEFDNISVKELPGNHATQATTASRPTYGIVPLGGRRNLLTRTEEFNDSYWTKSNSAITANADGVADLVYPLTSGTLRGVERSLGAVSSAAHTISIEAKASGLNFLYLYGAQGNVVGYFNLSTGAVGTVGSGLTATITNVGGGYYRCTVTQTVTNLFIYAGGCDANGSTQATASGTNGIIIRNIQLELGSTATAYQRVTTQYDVTESGVQSLSYLSFDGVDDFLVTPTITPGIDKVQVFAGVRKLSDAASGILVELSANIIANTGSFYVVTGPDPTVSNRYSSSSRGSGGVFTTNIATTNTGDAPDQAVLSSTHDIAGDLTTIRRNGVAGTNSTVDLGTGNFLAYPIYIGRRAGASVPFNGQIYNLIVRFGANLNAGAIYSTETFVNEKTGAY